MDAAGTRAVSEGGSGSAAEESAVDERCWRLAASLLARQVLRLRSHPDAVPPVLAVLGPAGAEVVFPTGPDDLARRKRSSAGWAVVSDARLRTPGGPRDALVVEVAPGGPLHTLVLPYQGLPPVFSPDRPTRVRAVPLRGLLEGARLPDDAREAALAALGEAPGRPFRAEVRGAKPPTPGLGEALGGVAERVQPDGLDLWSPGASVRGVQLIVGPDRVTVRVPSFGSAADRLLAARVLQHLAEGGAVVSLDGTELAAASISSRLDEPWARRQEQAAVRELLELAGEGQVTVPTVGRAATIGPKVLAQVQRAPDPASALMTRLLGVASAGPIRVVVGADGPVQPWVGGPDLLSTQVARAALARTPDVQVVPMAVLVAALGPRGEWWSEDLFRAPEVSGAAWDELRARLSAAPPPPPHAGPGPVPALRALAPLTRWSAAAVLAAPHAVAPLVAGVVAAALHVAGADGRVDEEERTAIGRFLEEGIREPGPLRALLGADPGPATDALAGMTRGRHAPDEVLHTVLAALDGLLAPALRASYADLVRAAARAAAEASGPRRWGLFGDRVGPEEREALASLDRALARFG